MIERKSGDIAYQAGRWPMSEGKPTIVFIHGSSNTKLLWEQQVDYLSDLANTIALDLPGHGESEGDGMDCVKGYSSVVSDFIDAIKAPRPVLCGLSLGGAIALQMLLNNNSRYFAGILMNTGAKLRVLPEILERIRNDYNGYISMIRTFAVSEKSDLDRKESLIRDMAKCRAEVAYKDFKSCDEFNVMDKLSMIDVPVLVITSDDDNLTPEKYGIYLADKIMNSRRVHIMNSGHFSPVEQPEMVNKAISEFIKSIEQ